MPLDPAIYRQYPDHWEELRRRVLKEAEGKGPLDNLRALAAEHPEKTDPEALAALRARDAGPSAACEFCGVPQGEKVERYDEYWTLALPDAPARQWFDGDGRPIASQDELPSLGETNEVEILLSVAHLCQDPRCDRLEHLVALCRRCHMRLDNEPTHRRTRRLLYAEFRGQQRLACCPEPGCAAVSR